MNDLFCFNFKKLLYINNDIVETAGVSNFLIILYMCLYNEIN